MLRGGGADPDKAPVLSCEACQGTSLKVANTSGNCTGNCLMGKGGGVAYLACPNHLRLSGPWAVVLVPSRLSVGSRPPRRFPR